MLIKFKFLHNNKSSDVSFPSFMKYFLPTAINIKRTNKILPSYFSSIFLNPHLSCSGLSQPQLTLKDRWSPIYFVLFLSVAFQEMDISCSGTSTWIFEYYVQHVSLADGTDSSHNNIMQNLMRNIYFMNNFNTIKFTPSPCLSLSEISELRDRKKQMSVPCHQGYLGDL